MAPNQVSSIGKRSILRHISFLRASILPFTYIDPRILLSFGCQLFTFTWQMIVVIPMLEGESELGVSDHEELGCVI